jgi:hypothetical protein
LEPGEAGRPVAVPDGPRERAGRLVPQDALRAWPEALDELGAPGEAEAPGELEAPGALEVRARVELLGLAGQARRGVLREQAAQEQQVAPLDELGVGAVADQWVSVAGALAFVARDGFPRACLARGAGLLAARGDFLEHGLPVARAVRLELFRALRPPVLPSFASLQPGHAGQELYRE